MQQIMPCLPQQCIADVSVTDDVLMIETTDGSVIAVPLAWFPPLLQASPEARSHWSIAQEKQHIQWTDIDLTIGIEEIRGYKSPSCCLCQYMQS